MNLTKILTMQFITILVFLCFLSELASPCFLFPKYLSQPRFPDGPGDGTLLDIGDAFRSNTNNDNQLFNAVLNPFKTLLIPSRSVKVWLPPKYYDQSNKERRYPVLYCHDGQNAVNDKESWTGHSFRLTGALSELIRNDNVAIDEPIVVLIPSMSEDMIPGVRRRHLEYGDGIVGQIYIDAIVNELKPRIDKAFRTRPGAENNFSIGSSLGGQISYLSALKYPDIFGGAAGLSPCFQGGLLTSTLLDGSTLKGKRLYMDNGGDVGSVRVPLIDPLDHIDNWNPGYFWLDSQLQPGIDAMRTVLKLHGVSHEYRLYPGGRHNEREWARRIDRALISLLSMN